MEPSPGPRLRNASLLEGWECDILPSTSDRRNALNSDRAAAPAGQLELLGGLCARPLHELFQVLDRDASVTSKANRAQGVLLDVQVEQRAPDGQTPRRLAGGEQ